MSSVDSDTMKQRFFDALDGGRPKSSVPIWELNFHLWDQFSGEHVVLGEEFEALSAAGAEAALHRNAEIMYAVGKKLGFGAITLPQNYWEVSPGVPAYLILPQEARIRQVEIAKKTFGDEIAIVVGTGGIIMADYDPEFCFKLYDAPEEIDEQCRSLLKTGLERARRFRDAGADVATSSSDIADNSGPFFKPNLFDRFIMPYLREFADGCKSMGLRSILHTDGFLPDDYLEKIADSGISGMQAIDPIAGMDIRKTKDIVKGRLCLCGNVDCGLLVAGTPEAVYAATRELLVTCKEGGAFVLGASNAVQAEVSVANYEALLQAWQEFGKY